MYRTLAKDESNALLRRELAIVLSEQGFILLMDGKPAPALRSYRESLAIVQTLAAADPQNALLRGDIGDDSAEVGRSLLMVGRVRDGVSMFEKVRESVREGECGRLASGALSIGCVPPDCLEKGWLAAEEFVKRWEDFARLFLSWNKWPRFRWLMPAVAPTLRLRTWISRPR